jgi:NitT/TauT family transport system permease protein
MTVDTAVAEADVFMKKWGGLKRERIIQIAALIITLIAWELVGRHLGVFILAPPSAMGSAFVEMIATGELYKALLDSFVGLAVGFALAVLFGISIGFIMGWSRPVALVLDPFISAIYVVPVAAVVPLLIVWLGIGLTARVVTVMLFCMFEILIATYTGVRETNERLIEMARSFGANQRQLFSKVVFFCALPVLFAGLRIGAGRAIKGMVISELLFAVTGLGGLVLTYSVYYRTDKVMVVVALISLIGVVFVSLVQLVERGLAPWWHE